MSISTKPIVNRVAASGIITLDLEQLVPNFEVTTIDLKNFLFQELILREKDFRSDLKQKDWSVYKDKHVSIFCSADAIVPKWAYMLVVTYLKDIAKETFFGNEEDYKQHLINQFFLVWDVSEFNDKRVVLKGCGDDRVTEAAYLAATAKLLPVVKSLMYGEPCSNVPIYKKPK